MVREDSYPSYPDRGLTFSVRNLLTNAREIFGKNYWLAPDKQESAEFVLDLGSEKTVSMVELVNTHNGYHRDRSMKEFKVFLSSDSSDGPWEEVVHQTLEDSRQQADPLPLQTFPFTERTARFVKFNQISYYGNGGGLQYFTVTSTNYTMPTTNTITATTKTVSCGNCIFPFIYNERLSDRCSTIDGEDPWCATEVDEWLEMTEYEYCTDPACPGLEGNSEEMSVHPKNDVGNCCKFFR